MNPGPAWLEPAGRSALTVAAAFAVGHLLAFMARRQAARMAASGHETWQASLSFVQRPLPQWFLALGLWLASAYWPLSDWTRALLGRAALLFVVGSATFVAGRLLSRAVDRYSGAIDPALPASLAKNITWAGTLTVGGLVILNGLGLSITPMLAALGVGGLAVALALQEPLANFFAGVFLTLARQIRVGDYVSLDSGQEGYVSDLSWRSTRLRMLSNNLVVVPNSKLAQAVVINYHLPSADLAVLVEVGVDYSSDLGRVEHIVMDVGREIMTGIAGGVADFQPFIRFHTFADSSVNCTVILRAQEFVDQYLIKHEFIKRLHTRFHAEGIIIPFPIRTIVSATAPAPSARM